MGDPDIELPIGPEGNHHITIDSDNVVHLPGVDGDAVVRPDDDGGWDFGYNPPTGGNIDINNDGIAIDGDDVISLPDWLWEEDHHTIDIDGGEIEIHDDHISINDDYGNDQIHIDHEGIRVDLDGGWEAVVDIQGDGGVNIHHKNPNAQWPSYQIDLDEKGDIVVRVEDKDGDLIQIINQKPGQEIELPLYGANGESVVIEPDGTVHMPGPGGDAIAKPDGEGGWDFTQTPPDGNGGIHIDGDGIHHGDGSVEIPDWIWNPDFDKPGDDISLPDWWPDDVLPELPDRPDRPGKPGWLDWLEKLWDKLDQIIDKFPNVIDIIDGLPGGDPGDLLDWLGDILIDKLGGAIGKLVGKLLKKLAGVDQEVQPCSSGS